MFAFEIILGTIALALFVLDLIVTNLSEEELQELLKDEDDE